MILQRVFSCPAVRAALLKAAVRDVAGEVFTLVPPSGLGFAQGGSDNAHHRAERRGFAAPHAAL